LQTGISQTERGCVGDQPQPARLFHGFRICHALWLVFQTQPRSGQAVKKLKPNRWCIIIGKTNLD